MSAFLCSQSHIRALVTYALDHAIPIGGAPPLDPQALGAMLWAENVRSLNALYPGRAEGHFGPGLAKLAATYTHAPVVLTPLALLKQIEVFEYQSDNGAGYETSDTARAINALRTHVLDRLGLTLAQAELMPGYKSAPWGLDDSEEA